MKPIGPSVPLTRPSLVPPLAEQSPPTVRSPPPAASSANGTLVRQARLRGAKIYCKLRWLYSGSTSVFQRFFRKNLPGAGGGGGAGGGAVAVASALELLGPAGREMMRDLAGAAELPSGKGVDSGWGERRP